jgi:Cu(I)/Ag(I) efflux system membrane fusion protein
MKKAFLLIVVLALALGITYLVLHKSDSDGNKAVEKDPALLVGSKTSAFNRSIASVLSAYYELSDAFFNADTSRISVAAKNLSTAVDSIRFDQFKADSSLKLTAVTVAQSIPSEIVGLLGEKTLEQKKREFNMITADLYSLVRAIKYDGNVIYYMSCATAFTDSTEGDWLSKTTDISNPYSGKKNPGRSDCGEIKDSLRFRTGE